MDNNQQANIVMNQRNLKTDRKLLPFLLLTIITCGIYGIVYFTSITNDLNLIASKRDGKKTMHYCLMALLITPITCGIFQLVWFHKFSNRIGEEAKARGINIEFNATTYWLWGVLGGIIVVGPFIYMNKLFQVMNLICEDYNKKG
ncbi:MAG TPA: hypothetical protein DIT54_02670 [Lachnospiraceae bacterium]|nr:hypothetical protein [Lachnospiraceae bacterium]HIS63606.1 DUF4234 domain-containing protein [Candidatus Scybalomonas excrementigallinarum]